MPKQNVKIHTLRENEVANPSIDQFILFDKAIREGEGGEVTIDVKIAMKGWEGSDQK